MEEETLSPTRSEPQNEIPVDEELGRSVQPSTELTKKESFIVECPICYEPFSDQSDPQENEGLKCARERLNLDGCNHQFCRECLESHCNHAVSIRDIPIRCPASASDDCDAVLKEDLIQELLSSSGRPQYGSISDETLPEQHGNAQWSRYQRFKRLLENPSLISCSGCHELVSKEENGSLNGYVNEIVCPSCGHTFCAVHGDAHAGMSCDQYKPARQIRKSEKIIRKYTKPCSHCGVPIQKESGCDHIVCASCKEDMCFRCGTHVHLSGEMVRSCKMCEQNFIDHRHIWAYRLTLCMSLPFYLPLCIVHLLVMTVLTIATVGCFCCFGCGVTLDAKGDASFHPLKGIRTVFGMLFLPFLDLFRQCGIPCCCNLDIPELETKIDKTFDMDDDDDSDDKDDDDSADVDIEA